MTASLLSIGTVFGLNEAGVLSVLLAIVFCGMAFAVAALLRQSYNDQKSDISRTRRRLRSNFLNS